MCECWNLHSSARHELYHQLIGSSHHWRDHGANSFNQLELNPFLKDVVRGLIIIAAVAVYARRKLGEKDR